MTSTDRLLPAPPLPGFVAGHLPFERGLYRLQSGPDAGRHLHVVERGRPLDPSGPGAARTTLLLIHGNPTWSFLWRRVMARLDPTRFHAVAPDLLGFGLSDRLPETGDHQLARHADAL